MITSYVEQTRENPMLKDIRERHRDRCRLATKPSDYDDARQDMLNEMRALPGGLPSVW